MNKWPNVGSNMTQLPKDHRGGPWVVCLLFFFLKVLL